MMAVVVVDNYLYLWLVVVRQQFPLPFSK